MTDARHATIYYAGFAFRGGGAFMHAQLLTKELQRSGWEVRLISLESLPLPVRYLPHVVSRLVNLFARPMGLYYKDRMTRFLYRFIFDSDADLLVFEDIYLAWNSPTPSVTLLHAVWSDNLQAFSIEAPAVARLVAAEERAIDGIAHPIVTVSDQYRDFLVQSHGNSHRLPAATVIPLGIDVTEFAGAAPAAGAPKSLVFCGSLEARKNLRFLLDVFRRLHREDDAYRLTIIGDGPDKAELERYATEHALPVTFRGRLGRADLVQELRRHSIYVHPSVKESFSFALLEAKLSGLKTVAYVGLEVPAEFIDVTVEGFDEADWLGAILAADTTPSKPLDAATYSSRRMARETVDLAFADHESPSS
ncbi:MAG TPA: glycosyltransferase family 4 protein [Allosphingosinicella sp.]